MFRSLAVATLACIALPVQAADWKVVASSDGGNVVFVDVSSVKSLPAVQIRRPFEVVQIWTKYDFSKNPNKKERYSIELFSVNCADDSAVVLNGTSYFANGAVRSSFSKEDYDFAYKPIPPETIGYAIMEFACGRSSIF